MANFMANQQVISVLGHELIFPDGQTKFTTFCIEIGGVHLLVDNENILFSEEFCKCRFVFHYVSKLPYQAGIVKKKTTR